MKKVEVIIKPFKLDEVRDALVGSGIAGMSISEVKGLDPRAHSAWYRGSEYVVWFAPQIKVEVVVPDEQVELCVGTLLRCTTDEQDNGTIVVLAVEDMVRIRTGEHHLRRAA